MTRPALLCPECGQTRTRTPGAKLLEIDAARGLAAYQGRPDTPSVRLAPSSLRLLEALNNAYPRGLTREQLHDAIYGWRADGGAEPTSISVFVSQIRRAITTAGWPIKIVTAWGAGYALELSRKDAA